MRRAELVDHLDALLRIHDIDDYGPQGLQVEGRPEVERIVGMVDAGPPCVAAALERDADLLLVHHGIFWGPARALAGGYGRLVRRIVTSGLNLYAAHLALDAHPAVGNNAELSRRLGLEVTGSWASAKGTDIGLLAEAPGDTALDALVERLEATVAPVDRVLRHGPRSVRRVGVLSGGGASYLDEAARRGCDTVVTGETSHSRYHDAELLGLNVVYAGHYASETVGVQALGRHLAERFDLAFEFVDLPTGM